MRKIYTAILSVFLFSFFNATVNAQVNEYVFSPSSGTYTALAGGVASTAAGDDGTQDGIPLGFSFTYGGVAYTHAAITTNGFVKLGTSAAVTILPSGDNFNNSNFGTAANAPLIAPFWDDNNATGGSIVYLATGAAPNRTFSVEWVNIHLGSGGSTSAPTGTFKVTLTETANSVTIVYGTISTLLTGATGSIGLDGGGSFLSVTPGTPATASIITPNNTIANATNLTSGTTYTFSPAPPCVPGTLAGGTTQSTTSTACSSTSFTLSVTGSSFGTGITYQWESSPNGSAWSPIASATGITLVRTQTTGTYYRRKISCSGGADAWSSSIQVTQNPISACYCVPDFPSDVEPITSVVFSTINNTSDDEVNNTPALENFTAITGNVAKGQTYVMNVEGNTNGDFTSFVNVFVDWNQDGDFSDSGENYFIGAIDNSTGLDGVQATGSILVPVTALDGTTIMRVIKKYGGQATTACNTSGFGQAEDYTLNVTTPLCFAPTAITIGAITMTTAQVSFTATGTTYVEYGPTGFTPGTGAAAGPGGTVLAMPSPVALSGLIAGNSYDVYVRQDCGGGIFSGNGAGGNFTTLCSATNIPYFENFETAVPPAGLPDCIRLEDVNGNSGTDFGGRWMTYSSANTAISVSPTHGIRYIYDAANSTRAADDWFYLRGINLTAGTTYRVKFFYKASDGPDFVEKLEVKYGTTPVSTSMTNTIYSNTNIATSITDPFDSARIDFTPSVTGVYYIGFHAFSDADQALLYIDDISVKTAPVVDAGITGFTGKPTCPAASGVLQAAVRNYNIITHDFAAHPVTVTATIAGAAAGTISTTINTGTLAAGSTMNVALPAFNFIGGYYSITIATSSPDDGETTNDSYSSAFYVNPNPALAVVSPAAPQVCAGGIVQLTTQFTTPPAAPVALAPVSSGTISIAIPDVSSAGTTSVISVSGVPVGATITSMSVTLNATHTFNSDLIFNLKAPNGKVFNLVNRKGGNGDGFTNAVITSAAAGALPTANTSPVTGTYAADAGSGVGPTGYLSDTSSFAGLFSVPNGSWTLAISDNAADDIGTLTSWSITLSYAFPHPIVTWSPATGLYIDAAATMVYVAGSNAYSVYAKPATTTPYTVTTTGQGQCTRITPVTVTVNANPVVNATQLSSKICTSDGPIVLAATPSGGVWTGLGVSGNNFVPALTPSGTYTLSYTYSDPLGCRSVGTAIAKVQECPERLRLLRDNGVVVYPNPSNGQFSFRVNTTLYNKLSVKIYTSMGALVRSLEFSDLAYNRVIPFDLRQLPGGIYMVKFSYRNGIKWDEKTINVMIGH